MSNKPQPVLGMMINWVAQVSGRGQSHRNTALSEIKKIYGDGPFAITKVVEHRSKQSKRFLSYGICIERGSTDVMDGQRVVTFGWCYFRPI